MLLLSAAPSWAADDEADAIAPFDGHSLVMPLDPDLNAELLALCADADAPQTCKAAGATAWAVEQSTDATLAWLELSARRLGVLVEQTDPENAPEPTTPPEPEGPTDVKLAKGDLDYLAEAIGASFDDALADAPTSGGTLPADPWDDSRVRFMTGLMVGLWLFTRIYRLALPNG